MFYPVHRLVSYAQWPSEEKRRLAFSMPTVDAEASMKMGDAIAESFPELVLKSVSDLMLAVPENDAYVPRPLGRSPARRT